MRAFEQVEEFLARAWIALETPQQLAGLHHRAGFMHPARRHAHMRCLDDHRYTLGLEHNRTAPSRSAR